MLMARCEGQVKSRVVALSCLAVMYGLLPVVLVCSGWWWLGLVEVVLAVIAFLAGLVGILPQLLDRLRD
jgi:hypothetical protein